MDSCVVKEYFTEPTRRHLSTGQCFGIFLILRGSAHIAGQWRLGADDMLVCKPGQVFLLEYAGGRCPLDALWVLLPEEQMARCSTPQTDIVKSFQVNPEPLVRIQGRSDILMLLKSLAAQMARFPQEYRENRYAADVLENGTLQMFLALVLRACILCDLRRARTQEHLSLDQVFQYIQSHLSEDLTLEQLEKEFYVSRYHLIRLFKLHTGQTVHQYIVKARLDQCRRYIEQGLPITEVYRMGGFGGYNHFFRAFKHQYGMTPKEYYRTVFPPNEERA